MIAFSHYENPPLGVRVKRKPRSVTVNQHLVRELGVKRALYVEVFVMLWSLYRATNDGNDPVSIEVLGKEVGKSTAQLYRWRADLIEAYPQFETPGELLDALGAAGPLNVAQIAKSPSPGPGDALREGAP